MRSVGRGASVAVAEGVGSTARVGVGSTTVALGAGVGDGLGGASVGVPAPAVGGGVPGVVVTPPDGVAGSRLDVAVELGEVPVALIVAVGLALGV
jgi:hypothetical protein